MRPCHATWMLLTVGGLAACGDDDGGSHNTNQTAVQAMCERWAADRADLSEGTWDGDVGTCDPGEVTADGRANALRQVNLFRWMAGLPAVTEDAEHTAKNQQCALMMHANGTLSHSPDPSWTCYTAEGSEGAGSSNIATAPGVAAVDMYIGDMGNDTTLGHRRWILSNSLASVGLGSTNAYSCLWVLAGGGTATAPWTAWPPPGPFPIEAMTMGWASLDVTGWSIQSDGIALDAAVVTVRVSGSTQPVSVWTLEPGYGSSYALAFTPDGWSSAAGTTVSVEVSGIATPIAYDVSLVDCAAEGY